MNENNKSIKCRKCGGSHLTIKCGKTIVPSTNNEILKDLPKVVAEKEYKHEHYRKTHKVKIINLPNDFEYNEISEFAKDWGHIVKINTKNFDNSSVAVVEFKYEREADYFIDALNNTSFEHYILKVTKIEDLII